MRSSGSSLIPSSAAGGRTGGARFVVPASPLGHFLCTFPRPPTGLGAREMRPRGMGPFLGMRLGSAGSASATASLAASVAILVTSASCACLACAPVTPRAGCSLPGALLEGPGVADPCPAAALCAASLRLRDLLRASSSAIWSSLRQSRM